MVHRPADSRLLTNLLSQEKEYSKQLIHILDSSNASLASFSAYAAASPPPTSNVIMNVVGSLAAADEALRQYTRGVEEWREMMKLLKEAEDEVGNIMRDREILVNRLIKASKSERKSSTGNFRDSLLLGHNRLPSSSSSLSLSVGNQESPSPSPSRPLSASFTSSSKLSAAQAELQACENHLAAKERELAVKRCVTVRDGLGTRIRALIECGWVWSEAGKQALQALEELKVENLEQHPLPPPLLHEARLTSLSEDQGYGALHTEPVSTRPSSDLSSISPSQSASQRGEESLPPPISIGSLMGQLGEPPKKDDANDNPHDTLQVQTHMSTRPSSGFSMATTTGSSIYYSPATPATCRLETITYAPAVALHVPPAKEQEREREIYGLLHSSPAAGPSGSNANGDVPPPEGSELFKDTFPLHSMHIPAPHALDDEYAYRIPTAHQTPPSSELAAGPSGHGQQHDRQPSASSGPSTPQSTSSFLKASNISQQQLVSVTAPRRVLERRITEEDIHKMSLDRGESGGDASSSVDEEVVDESELLKEGKLEVVENPRFMSEERRKEVEKEKKRREEEERKRREREEREREREKEIEKEKEKRRFTFFHSSHSRNVPEARREEQTQPGHVRFTEEPEPQQQPGASPSKLKLTNPSSASPSKGFLGSLKDFFVGSKQSPASSPVPSPVSHGRSRSLSLPRTASNLAASDDEAEDDSDSDAPGKGSRGGLQGIFHGKKSKIKKDKGKVKEHATPRWYTRTDKNIREIAERRGSYDGVVGSGSSSGTGVGRSSVGRGLAGDTVTNAGKPPLRNRAVSDVGISPTTSPIPSVGAAAGKRLKKPRAGGGPPISPSALAAASGARGGEDSGTVPSTASSAIVEPPTTAKTTNGRAPIPAFSSPGTAKAGPSSILKTTHVPAPAAMRRSASVDGDSVKRKSWVDDDENEEEEEEEANGMIVDLGRRRRTASEVEKSPAAATSPTAKSTPAKSTLRKGKTTGAAAPAKTKEYSSDSAAMTSASAQGVTRKKSLTKKRGQPVSASPSVPIVIPPVPSTMPPVPTAPPLTASAISTPAKKATLKAPSSASSSPYPSHRGTQSSTTLATVLPANNDKPSGTLISAGAQLLAWNVGGGLSRNSSITSAASAPPGGRGGKRQSSLGQGITSGGSGVSAGLVRRSSFGGGVPTTATSKSSTPPLPAATPIKAAGAPAPATSTGSSTGSSVVHYSPAAPSLLSIVEGVSRVNKEGWGQEKTRKSVGGTQKPAGMLVELGSVKAPAPVKREALASLGEKQIKGLVSGAGMASTSSLATVTPRSAPASGAKSGPALFEIKAPGSVFDARNLPTFGAKPEPALPVAQPQPQRAAPSLPSQPRYQQQEELQVWATGTVPNGSAIAVPKAPSPLRSALRNSTSRSPSPAAVRLNGTQQAQTQAPPHNRPTTSVPKEEKEETAPPPVDGTLPWGSDGALKQPVNGGAVDKGKGKEKEMLPPEPVEDADETSDTETYETGNESFSDHEEKVEREQDATGPAVIVSHADSPSTSKLANGAANGHAVGYDHEHEHAGSPKTDSVLSRSDISTLRDTQSLQPQVVATNTSTPASSTSSGPRRRKSVRVSLQPTYSPSPPAIEYTPDEEQKEYAPWASNESRQGEHRPAHHHPHHPLAKPTTIATQLLSRHPPPASAGTATPGEAEKVRDMWADSDESEDEHYARAKRLLTRAAKKEKDVQLLVANRTR